MPILIFILVYFFLPHPLKSIGVTIFWLTQLSTILQQGQGLGRSEQGMAQALSVEKTSRRGGRIVHEKDLMPPPMFGESFKSKGEESATPPRIEDTIDEYGEPVVNPEDFEQDLAAQNTDNKPSITDLMRNPSKVVLCQVCIIKATYASI